MHISLTFKNSISLSVSYICFSRELMQNFINCLNPDDFPFLQHTKGNYIHLYTSAILELYKMFYVATFMGVLYSEVGSPHMEIVKL